jgi:hypothetical protein
MGRPTYEGDPDTTERLYVRHVPLSEGYDPNGTYFGCGEPLYWIATKDCEVDRMIRAKGREDALQQARELYPNAKVSKR